MARRPELYLPAARLAARRGIVCRETDIVIEGYPRCANSFAEAAFRVAQNSAVRMGHHSHAPAQVLAAVRWGIPTVVLFRDPDDAVVSRMMRSEWMTARSAYEEYNWFYQSIWPSIDNCVLSSFELTTRSFGEVIERVNVRYNTSFARFDDADKQEVRKAFGLVDSLACDRIGQCTDYSQQRGSRALYDREKRKAQLHEQVKSKEFAALRRRAADIYGALLDRTPRSSARSPGNEVDARAEAD